MLRHLPIGELCAEKDVNSDCVKSRPVAALPIGELRAEKDVNRDRVKRRELRFALILR